jgi:hypothetical protein
MCGRFTLRTPARDMVEIFELLRDPDLTPRFNFAPTQQVLVVRPDNKPREWTSMRWGLVPSWAPDAKSGPPMINARAETIATKPAFRNCVQETSLPDPRRRLLRVEEDERLEAAQDVIEFELGWDRPVRAAALALASGKRFSV